MLKHLKTSLFTHLLMDEIPIPQGGADYLQDLIDHMGATTGRIASVIGRYYAMDRDKRWERVARAYHLLVNGKGNGYTRYRWRCQSTVCGRNNR